MIKLIPIACCLLAGFAANAQNVQTLHNINASQGPAYLDLQRGDTVKANGGWDISLVRTTLLVHDSAQVVNVPFEQLEKAPTEGYSADNDTRKAVPAGSGNGWYTYDMEEHTITPIPGKTIVVKTTDGQYIKIQITSYYKDEKPYNAGAFYSLRYAFIH